MDESQLEAIVDDLRNFIDIDSKNKTNKEIIFEHFSDAIKYCDKYLISDFVIKEAVYDSEFNELIKTNFRELLDILPTFSVGSFLARVSRYNPEVIKENIDYIISEDNIENFWAYFVAIKGKDEDIDHLINEKINSSDNIFAKAIVHNYLLKKENENYKWRVDDNPNEEITEESKKNLAITLGYVIKELLDETNSNYTDINYVDAGVFSEVYKIGNKVFKIGDKLNQYEIPNHRRLLQPIARANYTLKNGNVIACIQVTPAVDTYFSNEEKTDEKLYEIYKELRNDGIIWIDAKWENLGKLLDDNVTKWRGKRVEISPQSVGLDKKYVGEPLRKGNIVIIDLDMIYREENPNIPWVKMSDISKEFEERYLEEKTNKISRDEDR